MGDAPNIDILQVIADWKLGIIAVLWIIGFVLKTYINMTNKYIPVIVIAIGMILGYLGYHVQVGIVGSLVVGFLYGFLSIGGHSAMKNSLGP